MADLIVNLPNHGYVEGTYVVASWLSGGHYVRDPLSNSFKLSTTNDDSNIIQFSASITSGTVQQTSASGSGTISGLDHLIGETVQVFADGKYIGEYVVDGSGEISPVDDFGTVLVGKGYTSSVLPMKFNVQESGLLSKKRQVTAILSFYNTNYARYGHSASSLYDVPFKSEQLANEDVVVHPDTGHTRNCDIYVRSDKPLPCTLLGMSFIVDAATG